MSSIGFICGHCKSPSVGKIHHHETTAYRSEEGTPLDYRVEAPTTCGRCKRISILTFEFWGLIYGRDEVESFTATLDGDEVISEQPREQFPTLIRPPPSGSPQELYSAWKEAELAFSRNDIPTVATIAYRRVLESAAKYIDPDHDDQSKAPLGIRLKRLKESGVISQDLYSLTEQALSFGNAAAHEAEPLKSVDALVARDLAEAFLRQAFSVPKLLNDAKAALSERTNSKK
jgi:hypothetical protein